MRKAWNGALKIPWKNKIKAKTFNIENFISLILETLNTKDVYALAKIMPKKLPNW